MTRFPKFKFIGSFLSLMLLGSTCLTTLNSCDKDNKNDEPEIETPINPEPENPDDDPNEQPSDDPNDDPNEDPSDDPNEDPSDDPNGDEVNVPEAFIGDYELGYVVMPDGTPEQYKEYTGFILSYNKDNHTPNYVSWELTLAETSGSADRNDYNFWVDTSISGCTSTDYGFSSHNTWERGHMCPAADQKWSSTAMKDCMVMTNMVPQHKNFNGKMWATLENKERTWAKRDRAIWIICGPIYYDTDTDYIGNAKARVPSGCFKVFLYYNGENSRAIAFAFPNQECGGNLQDYAMSVDELEDELGYDFFSALPDDVENAVESTFSFTDWNK